MFHSTEGGKKRRKKHIISKTHTNKLKYRKKSTLETRSSARAKLVLQNLQRYALPSSSTTNILPISLIFYSVSEQKFPNLLIINRHNQTQKWDNFRCFPSFFLFSKKKNFFVIVLDKNTKDLFGIGQQWKHRNHKSKEQRPFFILFWLKKKKKNKKGPLSPQIRKIY